MEIHNLALLVRPDSNLFCFTYLRAILTSGSVFSLVRHDYQHCQLPSCHVDETPAQDLPAYTLILLQQKDRSEHVGGRRAKAVTAFRLFL